MKNKKIFGIVVGIIVIIIAVVLLKIKQENRLSKMKITQPRLKQQ